MRISKETTKPCSKLVPHPQEMGVLFWAPKRRSFVPPHPIPPPSLARLPSASCLFAACLLDLPGLVARSTRSCLTSYEEGGGGGSSCVHYIDGIQAGRGGRRMEGQSSRQLFTKSSSFLRADAELKFFSFFRRRTSHSWGKEPKNASGRKERGG